MTLDSTPSNEGLKTPPIEFYEGSKTGRAPVPVSRTISKSRVNDHIQKLRQKKEQWEGSNLCRACGGEVQEGKNFCYSHLAYFRSYQKERRSKLRAEGKCVHCGDDKILCDERHKSDQKKKRKTASSIRRNALNSLGKSLSRKLASGECLVQKCKRPTTETTRCSEHSDPEYKKKKVKEYRKRTYERHKLLGKCPTCGFRAKVVDGVRRSNCEECSDKKVKHRLNRRGRNRARGLCLCGRKPRRGKFTCSACSLRYRRSRSSRRERRKLEGKCTECESIRVQGKLECQKHIDQRLARGDRRRRISQGRVFKNG